MRYLLPLCVLLIGCGGGGGGGGTPPPPPPDPIPLAKPLPGTYSGIIDWQENDQTCFIEVLDNGLGQASGELLLTINGGTGSIPGTIDNAKLSYIGNQTVSILQYPDGRIQIVATAPNNVLVNVSKQ